MRLIINPRKLLGDHTYVGIFDINRVAELIYYMDNIFLEISTDFVRLDFFHLYRIDLCKNLYFVNQDVVSQHLSSLRKCNIPTRYNRLVSATSYKKSKKPRYDRDGIKIYNGSVGIVAYSKQAQMINQNNDDDKNGRRRYFSGEDIIEATGVLRFEVQLYEDRIKYIQSRGIYGDSGNLRNFFYNIRNIANGEFERYIPMVFMKGNFYTLENARWIVVNSNESDSEKKKMLTLLESVSKHQSIRVAFDEIRAQEGASASYYIHQIIKAFNQLNLNPITLPVRQQVPYGLLQGPYQKLMSIDMLIMSWLA